MGKSRPKPPKKKLNISPELRAKHKAGMAKLLRARAAGCGPGRPKYLPGVDMVRFSEFIPRELWREIGRVFRGLNKMRAAQGKRPVLKRHFVRLAFERMVAVTAKQIGLSVPEYKYRKLAVENANEYYKAYDRRSKGTDPPPARRKGRRFPSATRLLGRPPEPTEGSRRRT